MDGELLHTEGNKKEQIKRKFSNTVIIRIPDQSDWLNGPNLNGIEKPDYFVQYSNDQVSILIPDIIFQFPNGRLF